MFTGWLPNELSASRFPLNNCIDCDVITHGQQVQGT
jgi:hypothetical protein